MKMTSPYDSQPAVWRKVFVKHVLKISLLIAMLSVASRAFGWGAEGHKVVALIAEQNMSATALKRARVILHGASLENVASWADHYRYYHRQTGPWHYIDIPLDATRINLRKDCPGGNCVVIKTEQFLAVLKNPHASGAAKARALKFVVHFVGDMHQPLHCENDHDEGGNERRVIYHGHPDNLHWVWDTGLLDDINRNADSLAKQLERRITAKDRASWDRGTIDSWVLQSHRLAETLAYGDLSTGGPPVINRAYEREADPVVELQLERAGVRLAFLLDRYLH